MKSIPDTNPAAKIVLFEVYGLGFKSNSAFEGYLEHYFELYTSLLGFFFDILFYSSWVIVIESELRFFLTNLFGT